MVYILASRLPVAFHFNKSCSVLQSPTCCNRNAYQVVNESKDKVNPDPLDGLFREVNAANYIQQIVLQRRQEML